jgi:hypothetical protein
MLSRRVGRRQHQEDGMHPGLVVGGTFPDLELTDHRHQRVRLSAVAQGFPLVLAFYRGYW